MDNNQIKQRLTDLIQKQNDPNEQPYVKDASFYDKIIATPVENTKRANYDAMREMLPLVKTLYANGMLNKSRQNAMPIVQSLMNGYTASAEQDAVIRNEQSKRNMVAHVMQNMKDVKNPVEYANIAQLAGFDPKYQLMYGHTAKDQADNNQMKALTTLASINDSEEGRALQRQQLDNSLAIASMKVGSSNGISGINGISSYKDIIAAEKEYNAIMTSIEQASKDPEYQKNPAAFQQHVHDQLRIAEHYAGVFPNIMMKYYGDNNNGDRQYWINQLSPKQKNNYAFKSISPNTSDYDTSDLTDYSISDLSEFDQNKIGFYE